MKLGTFLQLVTVAFAFGAGLAALACSYVWAYHLAPFDRKFPTPWRVFEFTIGIFAVSICISVVLFSLTLSMNRRLGTERVSLRHGLIAGVLGAADQALSFLLPRVVDRSEVFLLVVFASPVVSGLVFIWFTSRQHPKHDSLTVDDQIT